MRPAVRRVPGKGWRVVGLEPVPVNAVRKPSQRTMLTRRGPAPDPNKLARYKLALQLRAQGLSFVEIGKRVLTRRGTPRSRTSTTKLLSEALRAVFLTEKERTLKAHELRLERTAAECREDQRVPGRELQTRKKLSKSRRISQFVVVGAAPSLNVRCV